MICWLNKTSSTHKTIYFEMEWTFIKRCKVYMCFCGVQTKKSVIRIFKLNILGSYYLTREFPKQPKMWSTYRNHMDFLHKHMDLLYRDLKKKIMSSIQIFYININNIVVIQQLYGFSISQYGYLIESPYGCYN